ncbi:PREDICTED: fas-binding factor 1 isoform X2 [Condylura cristata]|uniref:fas-binding factor 1 isoform X2 n=1 Tax=Condylura cristata TaxID=143302 RepID=UPI00064294AE|nr:PREDICTED: fas-binding factor 1 isoform X2 [Condylura cristata]
MAPKTKKGLKGSIDDVLGDLLGDEDILPEKPGKLASSATDTTRVAPALPLSRAQTKSLLKGDSFGLAGAEAEVSDVSEADPQALLQAMKDLDDMDADLLGLQKSAPGASKRAAKGSGKEELLSSPKPAGDAIPTKKSPPLGHQYRKFSFEDMEDPLAGLLSDEGEEEDVARKAPAARSQPASAKSLPPVREQGPSVPLTPGDTPVRKKESLFDDGDDIMATLGFGDSPEAERRRAGDQEGPRPARSKLDELLGRGTVTKLLARPGTGEHREFKLDRKYQKPQDKEEADEDFTFGAYQPTVSSAEGRQSRRQSVRFLAEGGADPKGEAGSKQSTPATSSPLHPRKGGADWLGLKDDALDLLPPSPTKEAERRGPVLPTPPVSHSGSQHLPSAPSGPPHSSGTKPPTKGVGPPATASQEPRPGAPEEKAEEDWLSHALARKKAQGLAREQRLGSVAAAGQPPSSSQPGAGVPGLEQASAGGTSEAAAGKPPARLAPSGSLKPPKQGVPAPCADNTEQGAVPRDIPSTGSPAPFNLPLTSAAAISEPATCLPSTQEPPGPSVPVQPLLPEPLAWSLLPSAGYQAQLLAAQAQLQSGTAELQVQLLQSQARVAELEAQVRKLELERAHHLLLLESLQQRHQADLELIEKAHRSRVKVLEASYQQREERLQRENEELSAQYLAYRQEAEQARNELTAQHQRRLAAATQEKDQEMERLQELQRASILAMRTDHEEQLQRLKLLKDREIDAVTSATSHTRSLNGIIEQMEKFSSSLSVLSSRVEASHVTTAQERELGLRQRDEQLRALQERLGQQQRDVEEERGRLHEVIGKMEARLSEQSRLLEQERWRVNAEQTKVESTKRALEEQRKVTAQQMAMEREELERAKSALLDEQKAVMHKCGEERRHLAAEWAEFYAQQKLSKERAEREAERAKQADSQREGTLIGLAKEQAELKIRASELRAKEDQLAAEREALERERQELRLEKERASATAQRLRLRTQEVEDMSQVASEKYKEGEQALQEARQVRSEQQAQLQLVQQQQEQLRQQEQHVHQARLPSGSPRPLQLPLLTVCVSSLGCRTGASESGPAEDPAGPGPAEPALRAAPQGPGPGGSQPACRHGSFPGPQVQPATCQPEPLEPLRQAGAAEAHGRAGPRLPGE